MKKIKKLITLIILTIASIVAVSTATIAEAATTPSCSVTFSFKFYKASDYLVIANFEAIHGYPLADARKELGYYDEDFTSLGQAAADANWNGRYGFGKLYEVTPDQVRAAIAEVDSVKETKEFKPKDEMVIDVYAELSDSSANMTTGVMSIDLQGIADPQKVTPYTDYPSSSSVNSYVVAKRYYLIGWTYVSNAADKDIVKAPGETRHLGAVSFPIDDAAVSKTYTLDINEYTLFSDTKHEVFSNRQIDSSYFNFIDNEFTIAGESSKTGLSSITVGGQTPSIGSPTTISGQPDPFDTYVAPETSSSSVDIDVRVEDAGTVESVKYSTTLTDLPNGGTPASTTTGGFRVDMDSVGTGETMYAAVTVKSSDGTKTQTYIIEIPKAKSTKAELSDISFTSVGSPYAPKLDKNFNPNTLSYTLYVPTEATNITVTPTYDKTVSQTCEILGHTGNVASGSSVTLTKTAFTVKMIAQDERTTKIYNFAVKERSTSTELTALQFSDGTATSTATYDAYAKTYTIDGVAFGVKNFSLSPTTIQGQTVTIDGGSVTGGSSTSLSFSAAANNYAAWTDRFTVVVTSPFGNSETYEFIVNRVAADTDNTIDDLDILDNNSAALGSWDGRTFVFSSSDPLPYIIQYVTATVTPTSQYATVTINSTSGKSKQLTFSGTSDTSVTFVIVVTSESNVSETYSYTVNRKGADNDATFTISAQADDGSTITMASKSGNVYENTSVLAYAIGNVNFTITPTSSTSKVMINKVDYTEKNYSTALNPGVVQTTTTVVVFITTEANSTGVRYEIKFVRSAAESNYALKKLELVGVSDNMIYQPTTNGKTYEYTIPRVSAGDFFKLIIEADSSKAEIYVSTDTNNPKQKLYDPANLESYPIKTLLYVSIYAESGAFITYTIDTDFTDTRDTNSKIQNIQTDYGGLTFSQATSSYTVTVPFSITSLVFTITLEKEVASFIFKESTGNTTVKGSGTRTVSLKETTSTVQNVFKIQGKAENESLGTEYTITVVRSTGNRDQLITSLKINGTDCFVVNPNHNTTAFNSYTNHFDFVLPRGGITQAVLNFEVSPNAIFEVSSGGATATSSPYSVGLVDGKYVSITIAVKSEYNRVESTGTSNTYTIRIFVADQDFGLNGLEILADTGGVVLNDVDGNPFTFNSASLAQQNFSLPYSVDKLYFDATLSSHFSSITGDGLQSLAVGTKTFKIKVKSEYATLNSNITTQEKEYTIKVTRASADTTDTLDDLSIMINGSEGITTFNSNTLAYAVSSVPASATHATITYKATSKLSTVTGDTGTVTLDLTSNASNIFHVYVTSEAGGTARDYKITVSREVIVLDSNNTISDIIVTGSDGNGYMTYSETQLSYPISLPGSVASVTVVITKAVSKSSLTVNGTTSNGTQHVNLTAGGAKTLEIVCTAEDGTAGSTYTLVLSRAALDKDATLSSLTVDGVSVPGFNPNITNYVVNVANGVTTATLEGKPSKTTSKITSNASPFTLGIGETICTITVTAEDTTVTKSYTVKVIRDTVGTLDELHAFVDGVDKIVFDGTSTYSCTLPYSADKINITAVATGGNLVTVTGTGVHNLTAGATEKIEVEVKTASGVITTYTINVTRAAGQSDAFIETYEKTTGVPLDELSKSKFKYSYIVDRSVDTFEPIFSVSAGATFKLPDNLILNIGRNEKSIIVTSETGVVNNYNFTVYRADTDASIEDINAKVSGSSTAAELKDIHTNATIEYLNTVLNYAMTVSYTTNQFYLEVKLTGFNAIVKVNGNTFSNGIISLDEGLNEIEVYALSEYGTYNPSDVNGKSPVYKLSITREAANSDSSLKSLQLKVDGVNKLLNFDPTTTNYIIENIGNTVSSVFIEAESTVAKPKAVISGQTGNQKIEALDVENVTGYIKTFTITCTAEDGSFTEYTITVARGPLDLSSDNTINYITFVDSKGQEYIGQSTFQEEVLTYTVDLPYGVDGYTISADKLAVSPATLSGVGQYTVKTIDYGTTKTYKVFATSQKGVKGKEYTITVHIGAPSTDSSLMELKADGTMVPGFSKDVFAYTLPLRQNTTDRIVITAQVSDPLSKITGVGQFNLVVGLNSFVVTVTAQDGSISNYTIAVTRDAEDPYLTDLNVDGEVLLDEKDKVTTFDKDTRTYHVIVTYMTLTATITAFVDNTTHDVTCSNATPVKDTGANRSFNAVLAEGVNNFTITVISKEGKRVEYQMVIQRRGQASTNTNIASVDIVEIPEFKTDYTNLQLVYNYTVPNRIRSLEVKVICESIANATGDGATAVAYNTNLKVGANQVIILVTAEDGQTTRAVVVNVTREEMSFVVDKEATDFEVVEKEGAENKYVINLGDSTADAIKDYTSFIKYAEEDKLEVKVLSDTTINGLHEVILSVSDGSEERLVTFQLNSTASNQGSPYNFIVWILIGVAVIILIIILICVNRDKYGSISKKRKSLE